MIVARIAHTFRSPLSLAPVAHPCRASLPLVDSIDSSERLAYIHNLSATFTPIILTPQFETTTTLTASSILVLDLANTKSLSLVQQPLL